MDLKDLRLFQRIAELGSLHGASQALGMTQPALSKSVRRLETSLGVHLFERTSRGVSLTPMGKVLYARNAALLKAADDIPREMNDLRIGKGDRLRVGTVPSLVDHVICPALADALRTGLPAAFSLHIHLTGTLLRELSSGNLDMVLATLQEDLSPELAYTVLGEQQAHVVVRKGHPLAARKFATKDLAGYPWVLALNDATLNKWLADFFKRLGLAPPRLFVTTDSSPAALAALLADSDALSLMSSDSLASARGRDLVPLPIAAGAQPLQVALCWRRSAYVSAAMRQFRQQVVRAYGGRAGARE